MSKREAMRVGAAIRRTAATFWAKLAIRKAVRVDCESGTILISVFGELPRAV